MTKQERMNLKVGQESYYAQKKLISVFSAIFYLLIMNYVLIIANYFSFSQKGLPSKLQNITNIFSFTLLIIMVFCIFFVYFIVLFLKLGIKKTNRVYSYIGMFFAALCSFPTLFLVLAVMIKKGLESGFAEAFKIIGLLASLPYILIEGFQLVIELPQSASINSSNIVLYLITISVALLTILTIYLFIFVLSWIFIPMAFYDSLKLLPAAFIVNENLKITNAISDDFIIIRDIYKDSNNKYDSKANISNLSDLETRVLLSDGKVVGFYLYSHDYRLTGLDKNFVINSDHLQYLEKDRKILNV